jgi:hypothetical protein
VADAAGSAAEGTAGVAGASDGVAAGPPSVLGAEGAASACPQIRNSRLLKSAYRSFLCRAKPCVVSGVHAVSTMRGRLPDHPPGDMRVQPKGHTRRAYLILLEKRRRHIKVDGYLRSQRGLACGRTRPGVVYTSHCRKDVVALRVHWRMTTSPLLARYSTSQLLLLGLLSPVLRGGRDHPIAIPCCYCINNVEDRQCTCPFQARRPACTSCGDGLGTHAAA